MDYRNDHRDAAVRPRLRRRLLDWAPEFSEEVLADWQVEKQEQFGPRWPEVQAILGALEAYGIFLIDVHPGNVSFED